MTLNAEFSGIHAASRRKPGVRWPVAAAALLSISGTLPAAKAVIFYSTADPTFNTTAPTGNLAGSGWQWVGNFGGYAGTTIGPHHFIAAHHVGGMVGDTFTFGGTPYTTTAYVDDTVSDLRIWQVSGTFPTWAPLYRGGGEVGSGLVVFGMGDSRGAAVTVSGALKGWMWGSGSGTLRWGTNRFYSVVNGGLYWGSLLYSLFEESDDPNEAHLAFGDSSGPVFMNDGSGWRLTGIAAAVDGPFNTTDTGSGFNAALFDVSGLYFLNGSTWIYVPEGPAQVPSGFYATRISVRASWIDSIVSPDMNVSDTPLLSNVQGIALAALILLTGLSYLRQAGIRPRTP